MISQVSIFSIIRPYRPSNAYCYGQSFCGCSYYFIFQYLSSHTRRKSLMIIMRFWEESLFSIIKFVPIDEYLHAKQFYRLREPYIPLFHISICKAPNTTVAADKISNRITYYGSEFYEGFSPHIHYILLR